jgi:EamA domain-containing membrane protein RarD
LLAVTLFEEPVRGGWFNYGLVWSALLIFTFDSFRWYRQLARAVPTTLVD